MSILLDALKQSQNSDSSAQQFDMQAQQQKQLLALKRYRQVSLVLGVSLIAVVVVTSGYFTGQWLQKTPKSDILTAELTQQSISKPQEKVENTLAMNLPAKTTRLPEQDIIAVTEPHIMYIQTDNGLQQVVQNKQGHYVTVNNSELIKQTQPKQGAVPEITGSPTIEPEASAKDATVLSNSASAELDLSKYKVLGKPLEGTVQSKPVQETAEMKAVPDKLKSAFAKAIQDTEQAQEYEVTHGSKTSSRAQPIELLPDGLLTLIPTIKYQAHIYSSTADKRWIKLNGRELYEGDKIGALTVREITPEQTVLDFDGYEFSLKALQDWPN
jgi:general secretion pathway protein B